MNLVHCNPQRRITARANTGSRLFNDIFDDFFTPFAMVNHPATVNTKTSLKVDIYESENQIVIEAELAGVEKEDISIDVKGKLLTLAGERKNSIEVSETNFHRKERQYGMFERKFNLPFEVQSDSVKANFKNGILKMEISKPEEQVASKISIN